MLVYEFEVVPDTEDGGYLALPFDFSGGTEGDTLEELADMASDLLRIKLEHLYITGEPAPKATFGNMPRHDGGRVMIVTAHEPALTVRRTTPSDAARLLGVSPARVTQLAKQGLLEAFTDDFGKRWITLNSVEARMNDRHGVLRAERKKRAAKKKPASQLTKAAAL